MQRTLWFTLPLLLAIAAGTTPFSKPLPANTFENSLQSNLAIAPSVAPSPTLAAEPTVTPTPNRRAMTTPTQILEADRYRRVVDKTVSMVRSETAQKLARSFGLNILDVTWEDTGRYKGSSVGPNISDMTIQVQQQDPRTGAYSLSLMPVIRHPNFSDESADVKLDDFYVLVGNEKDQELQRVSLRKLLKNLQDYLHEPESWKGSQRSLLAPRDTHALVSAQAAFLPIPQEGKATFNPVLFNYQSVKGDPAVLTILATRQGTSVTVIDNTRDRFEAGNTWGQRLFFNKNGERASLTGQRLSDFKSEGGDRDSNPQGPQVQAAGEEGLNLVLLIQVPLKQKQRPQPAPAAGVMMFSEAMPMAAPMMERSDVEAAVIGHGELEGPFTEIDNLAIERDPRFPIRVTVQFYKATSNGVISEADLRDIHKQIRRVYNEGDYVGSLVTDGDTTRPTEYEGSKQEPPDWWEDFWRRHEANTGRSRQEELEMLRRLRGKDWMPKSPEELQRELEP